MSSYSYPCVNVDISSRCKKLDNSSFDKKILSYLSEHMHRCKMLNKSMFSCMHCTNREMYTSHCLLYIMNF